MHIDLEGRGCLEKGCSANPWLTSDNRISPDGNYALIKPGETLTIPEEATFDPDSDYITELDASLNPSLVSSGDESSFFQSQYDKLNNIFNLLNSEHLQYYKDHIQSAFSNLVDNIGFQQTSQDIPFDNPNDEYGFLDFLKETLQEKLNSFLDDAHTVSDFLQSYFNSLTSGESTNQPTFRRADPLTLDLDNDGIELISVTNSNAFFDLDITVNPDGSFNSDGVKEQVGWIKGDDGILTLDKNNNGTVDNITELFGKSDKTGTEELREYDLNNDGVINSSDSVFSNLKLWQDFNGNGISESNELKSLTDYNITSINVSPESLTSLNEVREGN